MLRRRSLLAAVVLVMSVATSIAGCGGSAPTVVDARFVAAMPPHHRLGLEMIELGSPLVSDVEVRRLIFEMSGYHTHELHELEHLLEHWGGNEATTFPGWISPDRLGGVAALPGLELDIGWLELMVEHHEGAIDLARDALADGTDPTVRRLAEQVLAVQVPEVEEMTGLIARLCAEVTSPC
jgi:uncharacterized protein (DUF305 family)